MCLFFIDALLVCGSLTHARYEQQKTDDSTFNLTGWSYRVNAPHAEWASWGKARQHFLGRGAGRQGMERVPALAVVPGPAIRIAVLAFNLVGDMLRDILDPRLRRGSA